MGQCSLHKALELDNFKGLYDNKKRKNKIKGDQKGFSLELDLYKAIVQKNSCHLKCTCEALGF